MRQSDRSRGAWFAAALALACFLSAAGSPAAADGDPDPLVDSTRIEWASGLDDALKRAAASHRQVLVVLVSESAVPSVEGDTPGDPVFAPYRHPLVVRASRRFVCLPACPDRHGADADSCRCLPGVSCAAHRAAAARVQERYLAGAEPEWPEHWILDTDGRMLTRFRGAMTAPELAEALHRAANRFEDAAVRAITGALTARRASARTAGFRLALSFLASHPGRADAHRIASRYLKRIKRDDERRAAWRQVADVGTGAALSLLVPWLEARSPDVRVETLAVFGEAEPCAAHLPALAARAAKERITSALEELVRVLGRYAPGDARAYDALNRLARHRDEGVRVLATLSAAAPENRAIRAELRRRARKEANPRARAAAILGLAQMGDEGALPVLRKASRRERRGTIGEALDLAIRSLEGDPGAARALDTAIEGLRAESGAGAAPDARDRTDRKWRDMRRGG